jgi:hypothetical protein
VPDERAAGCINVIAGSSCVCSIRPNASIDRHVRASRHSRCVVGLYVHTYVLVQIVQYSGQCIKAISWFGEINFVLHRPYVHVFLNLTNERSPFTL